VKAFAVAMTWVCLTSWETMTAAEAAAPKGYLNGLTGAGRSAPTRPVEISAT
jgi:hypothetical protein